MPAWSLYPTLFSPACDAFETPELPGQVAQPRTLRCAGKSCQSSYAGLACTCGSSSQPIVLALAGVGFPGLVAAATPEWPLAF